MTRRGGEAFAFLLPAEGIQILRAHLVTHWLAVIRPPFLPSTESWSLLLLNNSFPDTGSPGCHPKLKSTDNALYPLKSG